MQEKFSSNRELVPTNQLRAARIGLAVLLTAGVGFGISNCEADSEQQPKEHAQSLETPLVYGNTNHSINHQDEIEKLDELRAIQEQEVSRSVERPELPECWIPNKSKDGSNAVVGLDNTLNENHENILLACDVVQKHKWNGNFNEKWRCFVYAMDFESGFNEKAINEIGAGGIPQALPASKMGAGWYGDARQQLKWATNVYIADRYNNDPCEARQHQIDYGWY